MEKMYLISWVVGMNSHRTITGDRLRPRSRDYELALPLHKRKGEVMEHPELRPTAGQQSSS